MDDTTKEDSWVRTAGRVALGWGLLETVVTIILLTFGRDGILGILFPSGVVLFGLAVGVLGASLGVRVLRYDGDLSRPLLYLLLLYIGKCVLSVPFDGFGSHLGTTSFPLYLLLTSFMWRGYRSAKVRKIEPHRKPVASNLSPRQRRSRLFVIAFVILLVALSGLATVLIQAGREDAEFQEQLEQLREEGR